MVHSKVTREHQGARSVWVQKMTSMGQFRAAIQSADPSTPVGGLGWGTKGSCPLTIENQLKDFMKCAQYGELVWLNSGYIGDRLEPQDLTQDTPWGFASTKQVHLPCWLQGGITDTVVVPENFNCRELEEAIRDQLGIGPIKGLRLRGQGNGPLLDDIQLRMLLTSE